MQAETLLQEWAAVAWGVNGGLDTLPISSIAHILEKEYETDYCWKAV